MLFRGLVAAAASLCLSACVGGRQQISTPFDPAELAFAVAPGTATVAGQASFRGQSGAVAVPAFGDEIFLVPRSRYTDELAAKFQDPTVPVDITNLDGRVGAYIRRSAVLQGGLFAFYGVSAGSYYIVVNITEARPALIAGYNPVKRSLVKRVEVPSSGTVRVVVDQ